MLLLALSTRFGLGFVLCASYFGPIFTAATECIDRNPDDCVNVAETGECDANPLWMLSSCQRSCGFCRGDDFCATNKYTHGLPVTGRGHYDTINMLLINSEPFDCYGRIYAWEFRTYLFNGGFKPGIYRPIKTDMTEFQLMGETIIPSGHSINVKVMHIITNELEWLEFEPGDLMGWRIQSDKAPILFGYEASEVSDHYYSTPPNYSTKGVGDVFTTTGTHSRAYSLKAHLTPKAYLGCYPDTAGLHELHINPGVYNMDNLIPSSCESGSYPDSTGLHEFYVNPGVYNKDSLIPSSCVKRCFNHEPKPYSYAAIRHGSGACYCGDTVGNYGVPDSTECISCQNEATLTCGDNLFNSVYNVPAPIIFQRVEFDNSLAQSTCQNRLGVEDGRIPDSHLTASSIHSAGYEPTNARLNRVAQSGTHGAWTAQFIDTNQWIQANLSDSTWVLGVMIQGRQDLPHWVTSFKVQYSNDGEYWTFVQQPNNQGEMIFDGNTDQTTVETRLFAKPIKATYIRIRPAAWHGGHISMRFELVGCTAQIFNVVPTNIEIWGQMIHEGSIVGKYSINYGDGYSELAIGANISHVYRRVYCVEKI
ncbi:uncharacterized protein [Amphiura filiformis]|uniref:uncharacterized protein n=1 Tax=Amphiura filiformis TaxID=82378 RepID=UPI003B213B63